MPRRARLLLPGVPLHITQRGHDRQACFLGDGDRRCYLDILRGHARANGCAVHAYVLMTNHIHLLASFDDIERAPNLIRFTAQQYSHYFNRRRGRCGTLWDGRYRSCPVPSETYLLTCHRYIEMNPIRAGMARHPADYEWSSYRGNAGIIDDSLLTPHEVYRQLGANAAARCESYRSLFATDLTNQQLLMLRAATEGNYVAGNGFPDPDATTGDRHLSWGGNAPR